MNDDPNFLPVEYDIHPYECRGVQHLTYHVRTGQRICSSASHPGRWIAFDSGSTLAIDSAGRMRTFDTPLAAFRALRKG